MKIVIANQEYTIPDDKPVVLFASYRTGSSALLELIAQQTGLPKLGETFHWITDNNQYLNEYRNKPCIFKLMPNHEIEDEILNELFENAFKIGIYRRDVVAQGLSFHIAQLSKVWKVTKDTEYTPPKVLMWPKGHFMADHMINCHKKYKSDYRPKLDLEFVYEDIIDDLSKTDHEITPKHEQYPALYELVTKNLKIANLPTEND